MKKNFLVTVSNDTQNLHGVQFLCSFFQKMSEHRVTLLHICTQDANNMNKALSEMWAQPEDKISGHLTVGAKRCLDRSREMLSQSKMSIDLMKTKTVAEQYGKVKDILNEGSDGLYDAIILGRRASYALQWFFERPADEIAQAMIKAGNFTTPLWICPEPEANRKNVLVCVDGSKNSLRAVDHAGYILSRQDQHAITLFHVENNSSSNAAEIFDGAAAVLREHHITDERITMKSTWGIGAVGSILTECDQGGYAAVVVGLHGQESGMLKDFNLAGGTTGKLINKITGAALWCCP